MCWLSLLLAVGSLPLTEHVCYVTTITSEPRIGHIGSWLVSICRLDRRRDGFRNVFASLPAPPIKNNGNRIRWSLLVLRLVFISNSSLWFIFKSRICKRLWWTLFLHVTAWRENHIYWFLETAVHETRLYKVPSSVIYQSRKWNHQTPNTLAWGLAVHWRWMLAVMWVKYLVPYSFTL